MTMILYLCKVHTNICKCIRLSSCLIFRWCTFCGLFQHLFNGFLHYKISHLLNILFLVTKNSFFDYANYSTLVSFRLKSMRFDDLFFNVPIHSRATKYLFFVVHTVFQLILEMHSTSMLMPARIFYQYTNMQIFHAMYSYGCVTAIPYVHANFPLLIGKYVFLCPEKYS